ncbi:hypothetical protein [Variovorax ureilyticus]|uniref:hypothetical protein n=1 Tax=Variovorax ureilyticus TaxID=1836198 RepID=UPI003BF5B377
MVTRFCRGWQGAGVPVSIVEDGESRSRNFQTLLSFSNFYWPPPTSRLTEPRFPGRTKDKLPNTDVNGAVSSATHQLLTKFSDQNPKEAKASTMRAGGAARACVVADKACDQIGRKDQLPVGTLPSKLCPRPLRALSVGSPRR